MKIKNTLLLGLVICMIGCCAMACSQQKSKNNELTGIYVTSDVVNIASSFLPSITLSDNNKFAIALNNSDSIKGTYTINDGYITLSPDGSADQLKLKLMDNGNVKLEGNLPNDIAKVIKPEANFTKLETTKQ